MRMTCNGRIYRKSWNVILTHMRIVSQFQRERSPHYKKNPADPLCQSADCPLFSQWWAFSCIIRIWNSPINFQSYSLLNSTTCWTRSCPSPPRLILQSITRARFLISFGIKSWMQITRSSRRIHERHFWILFWTPRQGLLRTRNPRVCPKTSAAGRPWLVQRDIPRILGSHARFSERSLGPFFFCQNQAADFLCQLAKWYDFVS